MSTAQHGLCPRHTLYGLDCDDMDRLARRSGGRCEQCAIPEADTPHGMLHIDHDGGYGIGCKVRGMLCSLCNTQLGIAEAHTARTGTPLSDAQVDYLLRPFWREPASIAALVAKRSEQDYLDAALGRVVRILGDRGSSKPLLRKHRSAIDQALTAGLRPRDLVKYAGPAASDVAAHIAARK